MLHSTFQSIEDGENIAARALGRPEIRFEWDAVRAVDHPLRRRPAGRARRADAGLSRPHALALAAGLHRAGRPGRRAGGGIYEADYRDFNRDTYARGRQTFDADLCRASSGCCSPPGAATSWPRRRPARRRPPDGPPPPDPACRAATRDVPRAEHSAARPPGRSARRPRPIARVAAEAAGAAALDGDGRDAAPRPRRRAGMVLDLPLDAIAADHLARDRLPAEDEDMAALRESPARPRPAHADRGDAAGDRAGALPYGLISGWRRLTALKALHAETGEARFATVQALVRRPETAADAYVAMVEENEIRLGPQPLRARPGRGAAPPSAASSPARRRRCCALFATASRPKRSRIRAFLEIYHALDGTLRFPAAPARAARARAGRAVRAGGGAGDRRGPRPRRPGHPRGRGRCARRLLAPQRATPAAAQEILPGVTLEAGLRGRALTLKLRGGGHARVPRRDPPSHRRVCALIRRAPRFLAPQRGAGGELVDHHRAMWIRNARGSPSRKAWAPAWH